MRQSSLLRAIAASLLAGESSVDQITARLSVTLGQHWRWLRPLAQRYVRAFAGRTRPRRQDVIRFLRHDPGFQRARARHLDAISVQWLTEPQQMQPVAAAANWDLPPVESVGALAQWLGLEVTELQWFADLRGLGSKNAGPKLRHYHYRILPKQSGNLRLIEAPKARLKDMQRQILHRILERIPPHPAVHGFVKGRSIQTFVSPHVSRRVVLRMDLQDFFPTFAARRIQTLFRTIGYPEPVADLLGGICTNAVSREVWKSSEVAVNRDRLRETQLLYAKPHLPQGAPTSPTLANLCFYRADCRLAGLAAHVGAHYTRYADDLAFSGDKGFERRVDRFSIHVAAILMDEGFTVHHRKTRVMRQGVRQHLAGVVANQHINVMRPDFDRLKATLTNCVRHGPESQNRDAHPQFRAHLAGRVAFVESINPAKGRRLRAIFDQIPWPDS